jgi:hypothetical protein
LGYEDETWWSRFEQPSLHSWAEVGEPMRLLQKEANKDDPDPKALSCYGLYLPELERTWLRFVDGRPVSAITTQFLKWSLKKLEELGKKALLLVWDTMPPGTRASSLKAGSPPTTGRSKKAVAECA